MTVTREPPANGEDCGVIEVTCEFIVSTVAESLVICTPLSSVTCTVRAAVVVWAGDGQRIAPIACEYVAGTMEAPGVAPLSNRQP